MKLRTWCIRSGQKLAKPVLVFAGFLVFLTIFNPATLQAEDDRGGITIRHENVPIQKVFQTIEKQSGYRFFYNETLLQGSVKVTLHLQNVSLQEALDACFRNQPLSYAIVDKTIIVKRRQEQQSVAPIPTAVSFTASASKKGKLIAVRGKVTSNNVPVAGASIMIKGKDNGASTDKDGVFTLAEVDEEAVLVVSSVSHQAREVRLNGQSFISIDLDQKASDLDEAVVVAYNTTTRRMNTGAVTVVKGDEVRDLPYRSVDKALQGLVPGLLVTSGTGQPGGGVSNFVLRGISTGGGDQPGSTIRNPLIVIDGVPVSQDNTQWALSTGEPPITNPMAQLNSNDIESISVLKDAAAIALYGSKASNGVILITTKKGKNGKTKINFRHQTDLSTRLKGKIDLLSKDEYFDLLFETYKNTNATLWKDSAIMADLRSKFPVKSDGSLYFETNWEKEIFNEVATTFSNDLSFSGGNNKSNYYLNLEYTKQNGIAKKTGYDRKSVRFNFENSPADWFKVGLNSTLSYNVQDYASLIPNNYPIGIAVYNSPFNPIYLEDGGYLLNFSYPSQGAHPKAVRDLNSYRNTSFRGLSKLYGEISFIKHFKFTSSLGADFMLMENKEKVDSRLFDSYTSSIGSGRIQERTTRDANLINSNTLRFDYNIRNDHSINLLAGQEAQILSRKFLQGTKRGISIPYSDQLSSAGTTSEVAGNTTRQTLISYFGQANYGFRNKYFFTGSVRMDGASNFGERNRFGTYWSTGLGWVVTEESFMKGASSAINYFKVRGSIGAAGNSFAISRNARYDILTNSSFLGSLAVVPYAPGNPDIKWEQTFTWDAGLEARFLQDRIAVTADIYKKKTSDVVYTTNLPFTTGWASGLSDNIGDIENKGVELSLTVNIIRNKNFGWKFNSNWSANKNILVKANVPLSTVSGTILANEVGQSFNSFYLVRYGGVDPADGKMQYLDKDGKVTKIFSNNDRVRVGKPQPDGFGAVTNTFSYKDFQLSAQFYYQYGFKIFYNSELSNDGGSPYMMQDKKALDRWQKIGDISANPQRTLNSANSYNNSTRYLYDGGFIRLQNVTLGYNLPKKLTNQLKLSNLNVYFQGYNLGIWTKLPGGDISNSSTFGTSGLSTYPNQKSFSFGLNATL